jgi:hypothetical protein
MKQNVSELLKLFQDKERSGRPSVYTSEQICLIVKVALEKPEESNRPISHWSARELADEVNKRKITDNISTRTVGRIFTQADLKPHKSLYWLNPNIEDWEEFKESVKEVCDIYINAISLKEQGTNVASIDEKTGIQALERTNPSKSMKPGSPEKIEFEYKRNGTLCLIPSFDVAKGEIIQYSIGETRNEFDFVEHIKKTIRWDSGANWIFIADQLNTHMSESLVKLVAQLCGIKDDLGKKGKYGILKNIKTRKDFLTDQSHKIRFVFTPKHCSWLNQVEIWFGILERKLLKRSSFNSLENLEKKIIEFISYYNKTMGKPFKWTYRGKPLRA